MLVPEVPDVYFVLRSYTPYYRVQTTEHMEQFECALVTQWPNAALSYFRFWPFLQVRFQDSSRIYTHMYMYVCIVTGLDQQSTPAVVCYGNGMSTSMSTLLPCRLVLCRPCCGPGLGIDT